MKRLLCPVLALCLCIGSAPVAYGVSFDLSASAAIVMDAGSGRVLYEENAQEVRSIASITKLMTALVAVEHWEGGLDDPICIPDQWTGAEGSSVYLKGGEIWTLRELLYGLLLASGNDAAEAIAYACGGDMETFVSWMNETAVDLAMEHSHFSNPSGLEGEGHYSTAYDMALLACQVLEEETLAEIVSTWSITVAGRTLTNHNKLLQQYEGCTGMKTGYTTVAGRTLISSADRDGQTLVAVTLNAPNDWQDHATLLDYGFESYQLQQVTSAGEPIATLPVSGSIQRFVTVVAEEAFVYPLMEGEELTIEYTLPSQVSAPIAEGDTAGIMSYYLEDTLVGTVNLIYKTTIPLDVVEEQTLLEKLFSWFS